MKKTLAFILLFALISCGEESAQRLSAVIEISENPAGAVDNYIFGHFIENLGRCFYGGIWDPKAPVEKIAGGIRKDVADLVRAVNPPLIRYPGGLYADAYHWQNGIGPRELRPVIENPYWSFMGERFAPPDTNQFGTDEFMAFLSYTGGEAYIQVNYSTGTTEEAAAWVEYVNGASTTYWGSKRAEYGHPEPYGVKIWGIGNEIWGFWAYGHTDPVSYAERYLEFAKAMKAVDPNLKFTAAGYTSDWNVPFLEVAGEEVDYLTVHAYVPGPVAFVPPGEDYYRAMVAAPLYLRQMVEDAYSDIVSVLGENTETKVSFDEWNVGWRANDVEIGREFTMREALFSAGVLIEFMRLSAEGKLGMANYAQLVNALGLIYTEKNYAFVTPPYYAFLLTRELRDVELLESHISSPVFSSRAFADLPPQEDVPYVDAVAVKKDEKTLFVFFINRHIRREAVLSVVFPECSQKRGEVTLATSEGAYSKEIKIEQSVIYASCAGALLLPPHSFGVVKFVKNE